MASGQPYAIIRGSDASLEGPPPLIQNPAWALIDLQGAREPR